MKRFELTAVWRVSGSLHIGTGLSRNGVADRIIRIGPSTGRPMVPGDAVKGAIRGLAERTVRWLAPTTEPEGRDDSVPKHPALRRLFRVQSGEALYRFFPAIHIKGGKPVSVAGTSINPETGVARDETLRVLQSWSGGSTFRLRIEGRGGEWLDSNSRDYLDLILLLAALVSTDGIGGHKGTGQGAVTIEDLQLSPLALPDLADRGLLERLQQSLIREVNGA